MKKSVKTLLKELSFYTPFGEDRLTALHLAAGCGHDNILKMLLKKSDKNVNQKAANQLTPLHIASYYGAYLRC